MKYTISRTFTITEAVEASSIRDVLDSLQTVTLLLNGEASEYYNSSVLVYDDNDEEVYSDWS